MQLCADSIFAFSEFERRPIPGPGLKFVSLRTNTESVFLGGKNGYVASTAYVHRLSATSTHLLLWPPVQCYQRRGQSSDLGLGGLIREIQQTIASVRAG